MTGTVTRMADRIRTAVVRGEAHPSSNADTSLSARTEFMSQADLHFIVCYGVSLDHALKNFQPRNDILYQAAESGMSPENFGTQLATRLGLTRIPEISDPSRVREMHVAAELTRNKNHAVMALADFAASSEDWTFVHGYAVSSHSSGTAVMSVSLDEMTGGWEFSSYTTPCSKEAFVSMTPEEKARVPSEDVRYGDLDECEEILHVRGYAASAPRM